MNDLKRALAAVRVLHDQATPNLDARTVALAALIDFVEWHTPKTLAQIVEPAAGKQPAQTIAGYAAAAAQKANLAAQQKANLIPPQGCSGFDYGIDWQAKFGPTNLGPVNAQEPEYVRRLQEAEAQRMASAGFNMSGVPYQDPDVKAAMDSGAPQCGSQTASPPTPAEAVGAWLRAIQSHGEIALKAEMARQDATAYRGPRLCGFNVERML